MNARTLAILTALYPDGWTYSLTFDRTSPFELKFRLRIGVLGGDPNIDMEGATADEAVTKGSEAIEQLAGAAEDLLRKQLHAFETVLTHPKGDGK